MEQRGDSSIHSFPPDLWREGGRGGRAFLSSSFSLKLFIMLCISPTAGVALSLSVCMNFNKSGSVAHFWRASHSGLPSVNNFTAKLSHSNSNRSHRQQAQTPTDIGSAIFRSRPSQCFANARPNQIPIRDRCGRSGQWGTFVRVPARADRRSGTGHPSCHSQTLREF